MVKAQSAVEYLMTYGWMLLVVAIVGGALMALYNPACTQSATGFQGASMSVDDFGVNSENELTLLISNDKAHKIEVDRVIAESDRGKRIDIVNQKLDPGRLSQINISGFKQSEGCNSFDLRIEFSEKSLSNQYVTGQLRMNMELDDSPFAVAEADGQPKSIVVSAGEDVAFNASKSSDPRGQSLNYEWDLKDGTSSTNKVLTHSYSSQGTYMVELNVTNQDGMSSIDEVEVNVLEEIDAVAKAHNETGFFKYDYVEAYEGENITLNASETTDPDGLNIVNYDWDLDNGTVLNGETLEVNGFSLGEYNVTMTAENSDGDTAQDKVFLNVTTSAPAAPSNLQFE